LNCGTHLKVVQQKQLDYQLYSELFYYEDGELYRRKASGSAPSGGRLKSVTSDGYIATRIEGRHVTAHRIIWTMHNHDIHDGMQIDHIDGNRMNNDISNLRCVTHQDNTKNSSLRSDNRSRVVGVSWFKATSRWIVDIGVDGRKKHIGYFINKDDAILARKKAEIQYGYHTNHGK